jgi:hypothetical protein
MLLSAMTYFLIFSCVVAGWAMLRMMGSERTQMIKDLETQLRREEKQKSAAQPAPVTAAAKPPAAEAAAPQKAKH